MQYRTLGRTGLKVSELGFGAWAICANQQDHSHSLAEDATSGKAIHTALELGCNFFDTADVYGFGHSEKILHQSLQAAGKLNDVLIATKVGGNFYGDKTKTDFSPAYIRSALEQSLKRLQRDYVDLYQLHNPSRLVIEDPRTYEVLEELKTAGKIRYYGVSVHSVPEGLACLKSGKPDTIQIVWNMFSLAQSENPAEELFPLAKELNIGIIAREPLANGFLTGKQKLDTTYSQGDIRSTWPINYRSYKIRLSEALRFLDNTGDTTTATPHRTLAQAALRFALDEPAVSTVVVGVKNAAQAHENFAVSELPALSQAEHERVKRVFFG